MASVCLDKFHTSTENKLNFLCRKLNQFPDKVHKFDGFPWKMAVHFIEKDCDVSATPPYWCLRQFLVSLHIFIRRHQYRHWSLSLILSVCMCVCYRKYSCYFITIQIEDLDPYICGHCCFRFIFTTVGQMCILISTSRYVRSFSLFRTWILYYD